MPDDLSHLYIGRLRGEAVPSLSATSAADHNTTDSHAIILFMTDFVPYKQRDTYQLHGIPPVLQRNIQRRATKQNTSFANIVGQALSDRCHIPFTPSQRKHRRMWARGDSLVIRVPAEVMQCIRDEAKDQQITIRSVILNSLSDSFGLKRPPATHVEPGREPGRKKGT